MTHRHAFVPIDGTLFAASYAQPGVLVCLECGEQRLGIDRERLARALHDGTLDDGTPLCSGLVKRISPSLARDLWRYCSRAPHELHAAAIADRYEADDE